MLAKARKSSFNANIGEFCSVTFVCKIFGVHGVQAMFLRLSFSYFNKLSFMN